MEGDQGTIHKPAQKRARELNPHLSIRVSWDGEVKIDAKASNPTWDKWLPSWPTAPH
jgi:hypothetical protein